MRDKLNVLITGVCGKLGSLIAAELNSNGHNVIGLDLKKPDDPEVLKSLKKFIAFDLSNIKEIPDQIQELLKEFKCIDVIIANAALRKFRSFTSFTYNEIDASLKINFQATLILIHSLLPGMKKNRLGRIINISSISAYNGYKTGSMYCSTKMALLPFAESLSKELKEENINITINTICPDSFSIINGEKLDNFDLITGKVLRKIKKIISGNINGKVYNIFTFKSKIGYIKSSLKKILL